MTWDADVTPKRGRLRRARCWVNLHDWRYFIDGSICRACTRCPRVQYDLPGVGR